VSYRAAPPLPNDREEDFRTLPSRPILSGEAALLRDIRTHQEMVRSVLEDDEDAEPLPFVGSVSSKENVSGVANRLHMILGFDNNEEILRGTRSPSDLFSRQRDRVEGIGVFVILAGNLGSFHSKINEKVFRGFAISDPTAPFIAINDQDAKSAWSFTLIHELAHILVGSSGVSSQPSAAILRKGIERFCNDVAGEFLLPKHFLPETGAIFKYNKVEEFIRDTADRRQVSESMVAYRLWRSGHIPDDIYRSLSAAYTERWRSSRERDREERKDSKGPSYFIVRRHRLGQALISVVKRTLRANELTHTKAARILGVKPGNVEPLLSEQQTNDTALEIGQQ